MLGVVVAMEREARIVRAALARCALQRHVHVRLTGIGPRRARDGARALAAQGVARLAAVGFAGALVDGIAVGDLLLPAAVCAAGCDPIEHRAAGAPPPDLHRVGAVHRGLLASVAQVAASAAAKRALAASTGAVAVDMESAAVAAVAREAALPWEVLRVVSDDARRSLPRSALAVDAYGRVRTAAFAAALARRPWELGALLALGRDVARAQRALAGALAVVLPAWCAPGPE